MTELCLEAIEFGVSTDFDVLVVGFKLESGDYVLFQHGLTKNTSTKEPPYFEFKDQLYGGYGLIKSCVVNSDRLTIKLSNPLDGITLFRIGLGQIQNRYHDVVDQLQNIFLGNEEVLYIDNV